MKLNQTCEHYRDKWYEYSGSRTQKYDSSGEILDEDPEVIWGFCDLYKQWICVCPCEECEHAELMMLQHKIAAGKLVEVKKAIT